MYSRSRLDALGDGIFAVAMTLLVLDIRLPDDFHPQSSRELLEGVVGLLPKFGPYALTFFVVAVRWLWEAEERGQRMYSRRYAQLWLVLLFLVTCTPFTTIVLGRFPGTAAAVWLYVGNLTLLSVISFLLGDTREMDEAKRRARIVGLSVLLISAAAAIAASLIEPKQAMWALTINFFSPLINRRLGRGDRPPAEAPPG
jgi:uncharacterized membrane protein